MATCTTCHGVGTIASHYQFEPCASCGGSGHGSHTNVACMSCSGSGRSTTPIRETCYMCHGYGSLDNHSIPSTGGSSNNGSGTTETKSKISDSFAGLSVFLGVFAGIFSYSTDSDGGTAVVVAMVVFIVSMIALNVLVVLLKATVALIKIAIVIGVVGFIILLISGGLNGS